MEEIVLVTCLFFPIIINYLAHLFPGRIARGWMYLAVIALSVLTAVSFVQQRPIEMVFLSWSSYLTFALSLDSLSGVMSTTVMTIGAAVSKFSVRYMADDPDKKTFHSHLAITLTCVLVMVNSSNLFMFWLAWAATSYFLHKLLIHFKHREGAKVGARLKFLVSRTGDVFILAAAGCLFLVFETLDFKTILLLSKDMTIDEANAVQLSCAGLFLVLGAMTKSALYPFHFWLPKTLETPTPVSALMHAGIINAGGFLIVKMGAFLALLPWTLTILAIAGGFTAIYGSVIMFTQTSVKKFLAYSTISQMGFMMLQCGLGFFSIAMVHIVGHAFYKAFSFLGAGSTTDYGKLSRYLNLKNTDPQFSTTLIVGVSAVGAAFAVSSLVGYNLEKSGAYVLLVVLGLAVAQIFISYANKWDALKSIVPLITAYFLLCYMIDLLLESSIVTHVPLVHGSQQIANLLVTAGFILVYLIQNNFEKISQTKIGLKLYVRSLNGGFHE